jgi:hypothetical protein
MVLSRLDPVKLEDNAKYLLIILNTTEIILRKTFNLSNLELDAIELFGFLYSS